eukprot:4928970-Pleurochrysis_carterae.AAC.1
MAGRKAEVWIVSETWPTDVQAALTRSAATRKEREAERQRDPKGVSRTQLSMPAAELFGIWAVAQATAAATAQEPAAVLSIGDCQLAAAA